MITKKMLLIDKITISLMVLLSFFLMCDVYITSSIVPNLAKEYGVSNEAIGYVGSAFVMVGAIITLYVGVLTDKFSRKKLLFWVVIIGEVPCFLTGVHFFTQSFAGFLFMRILTGIGVGGIYPLTFSLLADYCPDKHRAMASAFVDIAWSIGMMMGPILGGLALETEYGWRLAFILAAVPSFPLAVLFIIFARDPQRGMSEDALRNAIDDGAEYAYRMKLSDIKDILRNKTNLLMLGQAIPGCIPWGVLTFWSITYFVEMKKMTLVDATTIWELFGVGNAIGTIGFAYVGDKIFKSNPRWAPAFCGIGVIIGSLPCFLFFNMEFTYFPAMLAVVTLSGALVACCGPTMKAIFMNVNIPEHRGTVFSIVNLTDSLGRGLGPAAGSVLLTLSGSYLVMINFSIGFWLLCGVIFMMGYFTILKDRNRMLAVVKERANNLKKLAI